MAKFNFEGISKEDADIVTAYWNDTVSKADPNGELAHTANITEGKIITVSHMNALPKGYRGPFMAGDATKGHIMYWDPDNALAFTNSKGELMGYISPAEQFMHEMGHIGGADKGFYGDSGEAYATLAEKESARIHGSFTRSDYTFKLPATDPRFKTPVDDPTTSVKKSKVENIEIQKTFPVNKNGELEDAVSTIVKSDVCL